MLDFKIVDAKEKDIEILTSMKMVTMIDDDMDKILSYAEKEKIKKMFPGYVMLHMIMNDDTWYVVR